MSDKKKTIGNNIREIRREQDLSQESLAQMCGFSNTTLSSYENGRKAPGLETIAIIARNLNVSIERLYYGDENISFINTVPDEGKKIVNCVYVLWELGVIDDLGKYQKAEYSIPYSGFFMKVLKYPLPIARLLSGLSDYRSKQKTFPDPEKYLEILLSSVATEINDEIKKESEAKKETKNSKE